MRANAGLVRLLLDLPIAANNEALRRPQEHMEIVRLLLNLT